MRHRLRAGDLVSPSSWCRRREVEPRFGAVGKHGSIARIERLVRSMMDELDIRIPLLARLRAYLLLVVAPN